MGYLIEGYKIMGKELAANAVKHRAGIGTAVSVGGTILSNILSTKAGAKSARMIDAKQMELGRTLTWQEKIKLCWTNHITSGLTAGLSCGGAVYSQNQNVKNFNKVAMAYSGIKKLYDSEKQATREVLGEKKAAEVQDKINQKYIAEHPEAKEKILENRINPDPSTMRKFWEPVSGETIFTTLDKLELALKTMNAEMAALKPRDPSNAILSGEYGVKLKRLFELLDADIPQSRLISDTMQHYGFNKGREENGSDDEYIEVSFYTPMFIDDTTMETCAAINWETRPSDMRYGDYMKA